MYSLSSAARELGVGRDTVADLVRKLGLTPKAVPFNGNAKGLSEADLAVIRDRLAPVPSGHEQQRKAALAG